MNTDFYMKQYEKIIIDIAVELQDYFDSNVYDHDYSKKVKVLYDRLQKLKRQFHLKLKKDGRMNL